MAEPFLRPPVSAFDDPLAALDATATAAAIRDRTLSAAEVLDGAVTRAARLQPALNLLSGPPARARGRPATDRRAPFGGVPMLVKDLADAIGFPTGHGSRLPSEPARTQLPFADAMEAGGFVVFGKSTAPEFGIMPTTEPLSTGATRNPWNPDHSSGGSSGGAAAAVAAGIVPVAHASDGGGSIRIPASCCGVFGLKPSRGRTVTAEPANEFPIDIAVDLCVSRTVRDTARFLDVVERKDGAAPFAPTGFVADPVDRPLRIGLVLTGTGGQVPHPDVTAAIERTARLVEALGHTVEPTRWPFAQTFFADFMAMGSAGMARAIAAIAAALGAAPDATMLEPLTLAMAASHERATGKLDESLREIRAAAAATERWLAGYDVVLSPVLADPPPEIGWLGPDIAPDRLVERMARYVSFTPPHNAAGVPAISVPLSLTPGGLPVGSQFAAAAGREALLLALAYQLEAAAPWTCR